LELTVAPEARADLTVQLGRADRAGHHVFESVHLRKDGTRYPALTQAVAITDAGGAVLYRALNFQDVTANKRLEAFLRDQAAALDQAVQTTAPLYATQGHQLSVQLPPEPLRLEGDPARVIQVMVNLLSNAGKYTERGGRIDLRAERENGEVVVRVRDNGVG